MKWKYKSSKILLFGLSRFFLGKFLTYFFSLTYLLPIDYAYYLLLPSWFFINNIAFLGLLLLHLYMVILVLFYLKLLFLEFFQFSCLFLEFFIFYFFVTLSTVCNRWCAPVKEAVSGTISNSKSEILTLGLLGTVGIHFSCIM